MNPWLLAAIVLGIGGFALSSSKAPAPAPMPLPPSPQPTGAPNPLAPPNILAAYQYALLHETDPAKLTSFGNALISYGYKADGQQLLAKAAALSHAATAATATTKLNAAEEAGLPIDAFGTSTFNYSQASFNEFINRYLGTKLGPTDKATSTQVKQAVAFALAHEKDGHALVTFANYLTQYGFPSYFKEVEAEGVSLEAAALKPWVQKFAGSSTVNDANLTRAIDAAKKHGSSADRTAFGTALLGFTDFGRFWGDDGKSLIGHGGH